MRPHEAAALAAIDAEYEAPILYTGLGLTAAPIAAIKADEAAPNFGGAGNNLRTISFEILMSALPGEPQKRDQVEELNGTIWEVEHTAPRADIGKWVILVIEP